MPSTVNPRLVWKARTAASVPASKTLSADPGSKPNSFSFALSAITTSPDIPRFNTAILCSRGRRFLHAQVFRPDKLMKILDARLGVPAAAHRFHRKLTQHTITLGLRFVEPLVRRRLVGEGGVRLGIAQHIGRLVTEQHRFDIDEIAGLAGSIDRGIVDPRHGAALLFVAQRTNPMVLEDNRNIEVNTDFAQGVAQVLIGEVAVAASIQDHDGPAAPQHHLIKGEVFEVTAVREIYVLTAVIGETEGFAQQGGNGGMRPRMGKGTLTGTPGIAEPGSQTRVQQGHDETRGRRRVVAHAGTGGRS